MPTGPQGGKRPADVIGNTVTAADAARRIAERSGTLVLGRGSNSRVSLIEGVGGRFVLAVDAPRRSGCGSIYLRRLDGSPFESGHILAPQETERAARKLLGIYKREAAPVAGRLIQISQRPIAHSKV
jgi:hypothetical protein